MLDAMSKASKHAQLCLQDRGDPTPDTVQCLYCIKLQEFCLQETDGFMAKTI